MSTYDTNIALILTKEGAIRANQLNSQGLALKVTHMRLFRSPTPVESLPHVLTGEETKAQIHTWAALPSLDTTFPVIEDVAELSNPQALRLISIIGVDFGTFHYDIACLYLEDDTLYAVATTNRLITKRRAPIGSSSNMQEMRFTIDHQTVSENANFVDLKNRIIYTHIREVNSLLDLPKKYDPDENMYRFTTNGLKTYTQGSTGFTTTLLSQVVDTKTQAPVWVFHNCVRLFDNADIKFKLGSDNKVRVFSPKAELYPVELINTNRSYLLSLIDPNSLVPYPVVRLSLSQVIKEALGQTFVFDSTEFQLGLTSEVELQGILATWSDDGIYQDAVRTALRIMTEVQYAEGRTFESDSQTESPSALLEPFWQKTSEWIHLDNTIQIATSDYEPRLYSPGITQPIPYKAGAIKNMNLRATNVWLHKLSDLETPKLTLNTQIITLTNTCTATISLAGVRDGTKVAWSIDADDGVLKSPQDSLGYAEIVNGTASFDLVPNWGILREATQFTIRLVGYPDQIYLVYIDVVQLDGWYSSDDAGLTVITQANEGDTAFLQLRTVGGISTDLPLYLKLTEGAGFVDPSDLDIEILDSINIVEGKATLPVSIKNDARTEGTEDLDIEVFLTSEYLEPYFIQSLQVLDTSLTPNPVWTTYFATDSLGNEPIAPNKKKMGDLVYLIIKATDVPQTLDVVLDFGGDLVLPDDTSPVVPAQLFVTLINGFFSYPIQTVIKAEENPVDPGATYRDLIVEADRLTTYNIYNEYVTKYGAPTLNDGVRLTVNAGVHVVGTTTDLPAIDGRGSWPAGMPIAIVNKGNVFGRGGNGSNILGSNSFSAATAGGNGIQAQESNPIVVTNSGIVAGGGGGSGAGYITTVRRVVGGNTGYATNVHLVGGSGGRPFGVGAKPTVNMGAENHIRMNGQDGTLASAGSTPLLQPYDSKAGTITIQPQSGGGLGTAGTGGGSARGYNSAGAAAGASSKGPVTITNIDSGQVFGNAVP